MRTWIQKAVMMIAAGLLLSACPSKKGGSAAVPPGVNGVCTIGSNGQCIGQAPYAGRGHWRGQLNVLTAQIGLYQQFLSENQLCGRGYRRNYSYNCNPQAQFVGVSIRLNGARGQVTITPYDFNNWSPNSLKRRAYVTSVDGGVSSFNMVVIDRNMGMYTDPNIQAPPFQQPIGVLNNSIQLSNVFTAGNRYVITTTLLYRGVPVASGQLQGTESQYYQ